MKVESIGRHHSPHSPMSSEILPLGTRIENTIHASIVTSEGKVFIRLDDAVRPDFWLDIVLDEQELINLLQKKERS